MKRELFSMVFGILLAGCVLPSANNRGMALQTAIIPPSSSEPAMLPPEEHQRNLSDYDIITPPCTSETIQVAFDAYVCNTSAPIVYFNKSNASDTFNAWGATVTYTESKLIDFTKIYARTFYKIFISDNITSEKWSKDTLYSRILAHELCHVAQNRAGKPSSEEECDRLAGWGT